MRNTCTLYVRKTTVFCLMSASFFVPPAYADFVKTMDGGAYCYNCPIETPEKDFDCKEYPTYIQTFEACANGYCEDGNNGDMCTETIDECKGTLYNQACVCDSVGFCGPDPNSDADQDGIPDNDDPCPFYGPDTDENGDGTLDCQPYTDDANGDGIPDGMEDTDGDGIPDSQEDSDGDGISDMEDLTPYGPDNDGDGITNASDPTPNGTDTSMCTPGTHAIPHWTSVKCEKTGQGLWCTLMSFNDGGTTVYLEPKPAYLTSLSGAYISSRLTAYSLLQGSSATYATATITKDVPYEPRVCRATGTLNGIIQ